MSDVEGLILKAVLIFPRSTVVKKSKFSPVADADINEHLSANTIRVSVGGEVEMDATVLWPGIDKTWPKEVDVVVYHLRHEHDEALVEPFIDFYHYVVHKHVMRTHGSFYFKLAVQLDATFGGSHFDDKIEGKEASIATVFSKIFKFMDVNESGALEVEDFVALGEKFGLGPSELYRQAVDAYGGQITQENLINEWRYDNIHPGYKALFNEVLKRKQTFRGFSYQLRTTVDRSLKVIKEGSYERDISIKFGPQDFTPGVSLTLVAGLNRPDIVSSVESLFGFLPHEDTYLTLKFPIKTDNLPRVETFFRQLSRFITLIPSSIYSYRLRSVIAKALLAVRPDFKVHDGHFYLNLGFDLHSYLGSINRPRGLRNFLAGLKVAKLIQTEQTLVDLSAKISTDLHKHLDNDEYSLIPSSAFVTLKSSLSKIVENIVRLTQSKT
jgi:hypothetical protein